LFNYCFPEDYREITRQYFKRLRQEKLSFVKFVYTLETQANHVSNIDEAQKIRHLFEGANGYLMIKWCKNGMSSEYTSFTELECTGRNFKKGAL
ncbi:hypothetical protein M422DRAFT_160506, partial [Sphaerobolus stellatus SS14]